MLEGMWGPLVEKEQGHEREVESVFFPLQRCAFSIITTLRSWAAANVVTLLESESHTLGGKMAILWCYMVFPRRGRFSLSRYLSILPAIAPSMPHIDEAVVQSLLLSV